MTDASWWLIDAAGIGRVVDARGLLLGRAPDCDLIVDDPNASRRHAWVRRAPEGVEVVALGRRATRVDGQAIAGGRLLGAAAIIEIPGARFSLERRGAPARPLHWALAIGPGLFGLRMGPTRVGGGPDDDLQVPGLLPEAAIFHRLPQALHVELGMPALIDGVPAEAGDLEHLQGGSTVTFGALTLSVRSDGGAAQATAEGDGPPGPTLARFDFLPVGGRLELEFGPRRHVLELSELRGRLAALLLAPPAPYAPGEPLPDELVLSGIWPGDATKGRTDLNTLVHRLRRSLIAAGVDPAAVIERLRTGGAVRLRLARGAQISVA